VQSSLREGIGGGYQSQMAASYALVSGRLLCMTLLSAANERKYPYTYTCPASPLPPAIVAVVGRSASLVCQGNLDIANMTLKLQADGRKQTTAYHRE
jgi:hypothetical protein